MDESMDDMMPDGHTRGQLLDLARQVEERHRRRQLEDPDGWGRVRTPYRPIHGGPHHGTVYNMRLEWLRETHPEETRLMERAETLDPHLRETERRYQETFARIRDRLMDRRHLKRITSVMRAHPEISEQDRYYGTIQADEDAREIALDQVVRSY